MNHFKNICLIVLLIIAFIRCTEVYNPNVSSDTKALIVEGLITDEAGPFTIKLFEAVPISFDSVVDSKTVSGAKLIVTENENKTYVLTETTAGTYSTPSNFITKVGNSYKLHITTKDGNIYESNAEKLLSPQTYDSIRGIRATEDYLNGNNELQHAAGADILVNLFKSLSDSVVSCRFNSKIVIQYLYTARDLDLNGKEITDWHWVCFGWSTYDLNSTENITEEKNATTNSLIQNHSIGFMPFATASYGFDTPYATSIIYYLRVSQYTMNDDSYRFYKGANNQLSASGKIFDPITSQLYGNMKCVSNSSKIVLGLFEVSSVKQHGFIVRGSSSANDVFVTKTTPQDVPNSSYSQYKVWDSNPISKPKNDSLYTPIPFPGWWYHQ